MNENPTEKNTTDRGMMLPLLFQAENESRELLLER